MLIILVEWVIGRILKERGDYKQSISQQTGGQPDMELSSK